MEKIAFSGKNKRICLKKAISFFYDNFEERGETINTFLAKCRISQSGKMIYFYPHLPISDKDLAKNERK